MACSIAPCPPATRATGGCTPLTAPQRDPAKSWKRRWLDYLYISDERHIKANRPVSEGCDCLTCQRYSLGYLHHLFKMGDHLFFRLATIHNLRFMTQLCERMRHPQGGQPDDGS